MSATGTAAPQVQHQGLSALKASLANLVAAIKQQKYQLREEIISPKAFVRETSKQFLDYVNFVQNELSSDVEGMFYKPQVSLTGLMDAADANWSTIKELHRTAVLSDREAGFKLISITNKIMSVLEGKKTQFEAD